MKANRFLRFVVAGGLAALANMGSRVLFSTVAPYPVAIVLAYLVGMVTAFALNRRYVFTHAANPLHRQAGWFVLVNVAALTQTLAVSLVLSRWLLPAMGWDWEVETVAHVVGVIVPVFTSYLGHKHFTFR